MSQSMMLQSLTISSLIEHAERYHADTQIISVETQGGITKTNWGEVARRAKKLSTALQNLNIQPADRCGTIAWNNYRHLEIYFGVASSGRVCHTLNPRLTPEQMVFIVNDAQDKVLFIDKTFLGFAQKLRHLFTSVEHYVYLGARDPEVASMVEGILFYDELIDQAAPLPAYPSLDETTPCSLCYTSGTTGNPKGVLYTHRSTVLHSIAGNQPDGLAISARDTVLPVVPMFHVNAWGVPYVAAAVGCKLVLPGPNLDGSSLLALIDDEAVSLALGVPTIWMGLLSAIAQSGSRVESLKRTIIGGSALPPSMIDTFRDQYGVDAIHAWGMTETSPLGTLNQPLQKHAQLSHEAQMAARQCQGRPPYGVELRIVDENLQSVNCDGVCRGRLQIRGHWIVDTYFGQSESALTKDGWFDTGDVATIDPNGYITILDRSKDIIKSGGEWISTVELENIAIAHPGVANAAAIAAAHPHWAERPVLIVVPAEGADLSEQALLDTYAGKVAKWQIPDKVVFAESLPIGATGKVKKNELRDLYGHILMS